MTGCFPTRGSDSQVEAMMASADWVKRMARASVQLQGAGAAQAVTVDLEAERKAPCLASIPD